MKEPLLAAVVANESESSVPNESFDRAAWHSSLLGRACPRIDNQVSFRAKLEEIARGKRGRAWKLELPIESNGYGSVLKHGAGCRVQRSGCGCSSAGCKSAVLRALHPPPLPPAPFNELLRHRDRDLLTETRHRHVLVVADLQRKLVLSGG